MYRQIASWYVAYNSEYETSLRSLLRMFHLLLHNLWIMNASLSKKNKKKNLNSFTSDNNSILIWNPQHGFSFISHWQFGANTTDNMNTENILSTSIAVDPDGYGNNVAQYMIWLSRYNRRRCTKVSIRKRFYDAYIIWTIFFSAETKSTNVHFI